MSNKNTPQYQSDFPTFLLITALSAILTYALTPAGIVSFVVPIILVRFTGRESTAVACLSSGLLSFFIALYNGLSGPFVEVLRDIFLLCIRHPQEAFWAWTHLAVEIPICVTPISVGIVVGSAVSLIKAMRQRSSLIALSSGRPLAARDVAPLANLLHRRVEGGDPRGRHGAILGTEYYTGKKVQISDHDLRRHLLVAGTTGSGKTTTIMNFIEGCQSGLVIIDGKGDFELATRVIEAAKNKGRKALLFDGTGNLQSDIYNPFASGDYTALSDRIITLREWTEPHYARLAQRFAQTAFKILQICDVNIDLFSAANAMRVDALLQTIRHAAQSGRISKQQASILIREAADLRRSEKDIDGLHAEIGILAGSVLSRLFDLNAVSESHRLIDLDLARKENAVVYFALPALKFPNFSRTLGALIINDLKYVVSSSKMPLQIICDEFSIFAGPQILNLLNQGRGFNLSVILATQSLADIAQGSDRDKDKFLDQIAGSINSYIVHRLNSSSDRELMASLIGTRNTIEYTAQTIGGLGTGAASARHTKEFWVHPDSIRSLPVGGAFYVNKNNNSAESIRIRRSKI